MTQSFSKLKLIALVERGALRRQVDSNSSFFTSPGGGGAARENAWTDFHFLNFKQRNFNTPSVVLSIQVLGLHGYHNRLSFSMILSHNIILNFQ